MLYIPTLGYTTSLTQLHGASLQVSPESARNQLSRGGPETPFFLLRLGLQRQLNSPKVAHGLRYLAIYEYTQTWLATFLLQLWPLVQGRVPEQRNIVAMVKQVIQRKISNRRSIGQWMDHQEIRQCRADSDETCTSYAPRHDIPWLFLAHLLTTLSTKCNRRSELINLKRISVSHPR